MKSLPIILGCCISAFSLFAQNISLTVTLNGNLNKQVYVDGVNYPLTSVATNSSTRANTAIITNLAAGQHRLQIVNTNQSVNNNRNVKIFNLRTGYNMTITVNGNGNLTLSETRVRNRNRGNNTSGFPAAMDQVSFNTLLQDVKSRYQTGSRVAVLNTTFSNTANYFTTAQVRQLIQLVGGDINRLPLAKASYRSVVDPSNFSSLYNLLSTQASRNDLALYVSNYSAQGYPGSSTGNTNNQAMEDFKFNGIYNDIQGRYQMGSKISALNSIFTTTGNYFSTTQVAQLLQLITNENEMLQLAKVSYRTVVNPTSFTSIINSFSTQVMRDELAYYVRTFDPANPGAGYNYGGGTTPTNQGMSDVNFNTLYENIRRQWLPGAKKSVALEAFTNTSNYFTASQARMIVGLVNDEIDRLDLAKASYRTIVDPANYTILYDLFTTQARRDELAAYIRRYSSGSTDSYINPNPVKTAMSDVNFNTMYEDMRRQWLPGAKKSAVLTAFSNINYYFNTAQAIRLISLDNDEPDRLDMAKASLRSIVDQTNVRQILDLFTTPAYREDLTTYINSYRW